MNNTVKLLIGIVLMGAGLFGFSLDIDNLGHYFGTGIFFGIGLCLFISNLYKLLKAKKTE